MKKIITLLIVSIFLFSCNNNKQEEIIKENKIENPTPIVNQETTTGTIIKANEVTEEDIKETPSEEIITEKVEVTTNTGETSIEEEKILESEVNDLLNEFIDSLDNYDK